jgi:tRNA uridine 5-carboxymethylaminomethyl modification enzyme
MTIDHFDIAVIGAGHAGNEAAHIAAELGCKVALITLPGVPIGSTPCNPAIGGVGKGQVVREIDALGGITGKLADQSGIQYRILNESKGFAVQSTRVQVDKDLYAENSEKIMRANQNIEIVLEKVESIKPEEGKFLINVPRGTIEAKKVILTAGTFLGGVTHRGEEQNSGGRVHSPSSGNLAELLGSIQKRKIRFKTGTPPRLKSDSLDYSKFVRQKSDPKTLNFHFSHDDKERKIEQVSCYIAHTNPETMAEIRKNKEKSPIFNGQIKGIGPRYCPSIEDKAFRYLDRDVHHVFVEPEGLSAGTIYPNGISTSLPRGTQETFVRSIIGFEKAEIAEFGYAVEYDVIDTLQLNLGLEHKEIPGLFFAGQVNGTSGYEEAAGQGLIAGINAALAFKNREKFILDRENSYIGVMIEDLVTQKRDEPYRLFTARNENRLLVREDNAYLRMKSSREKLGLNTELDQFLQLFHVEHSILTELCLEKYLYPSPATQGRFQSEYGYELKDKKINLYEILKLSHVNPIELLEKELEWLGLEFNPKVVRCVAIDMKYRDYVVRAKAENSRHDKLNNKRIDLESLLSSENVSFECKARIREVAPETFGQLRKIQGLRPATVTSIANDIY